MTRGCRSRGWRLHHGRTHRWRSRGFTLLEVLAALSVTAIVVTLAGSALRSGLDVRDRILVNRDGVEAEARLRSWLTDLLRHPAPASSIDGALFQLPRPDVLTWVSQGVESPYGTGPLWRVTVRMEPAGLTVRAAPMGRNNVRASIETVLPHIVGLRAEALEQPEAGQPEAGFGGQRAWRDDWPLLRAMPAAVRLTFVRRDGIVATPLVVETAPLSGVTP